jgi:hypothetical protein
MGRVRDACFVVKDADGFAVSFVYYEIEQGRCTAANLLTQNERDVLQPASPSCRGF